MGGRDQLRDDGHALERWRGAPVVGGAARRRRARGDDGLDGPVRLTSRRAASRTPRRAPCFEPPLDEGGYARQLSPERRPYRTRDGYICALVYNDGQWRRFLQAVEREDLLADERFANLSSRTRHIDHVYGFLGEMLAARGTAEWLALCDFCARYYQTPLGEVTSFALPPMLRRGKLPRIGKPRHTANAATF